jgi:hypothetical protein
VSDGAEYACRVAYTLRCLRALSAGRGADRVQNPPVRSSVEPLVLVSVQPDRSGAQLTRTDTGWDDRLTRIGAAVIRPLSARRNVNSARTAPEYSSGVFFCKY